jgi:hypothetical protein
MEIQVKVTESYGCTRIYPVCAHGKAFAQIAGTKTLSLEVLATIRALGFAVRNVSNPLSLEGA